MKFYNGARLYGNKPYRINISCVIWDTDWLSVDRVAFVYDEEEDKIVLLAPDHPLLKDHPEADIKNVEKNGRVAVPPWVLDLFPGAELFLIAIDWLHEHKVIWLKPVNTMDRRPQIALLGEADESVREIDIIPSGPSRTKSLSQKQKSLESLKGPYKP